MSPGRSEKSSLCILVVTHPPLLPLARWTLRWVDRHWRDHPPAFVCGAEHPAAVAPVDDPSDWIGGLLDGVGALRERGFRQVYLILDDHPPVAPCESAVLNEVLPRQLDALGARAIHLLGWGQVWGRKLTVRDMGSGWRRLGVRDMSHPIRFCLHPTLWDAGQLAALLAAQHAAVSPEQRTPWSFESCLPDDPSGAFAGESYLIHGGSLTHPAGGIFWSGLRGSVLAGRMLLRAVGMHRALASFEMEALGFRRYYHGPYPHLWSGAMERGKPALKYHHFLRRTGRREMLDDLRRALAEMNGDAGS